MSAKKPKRLEEAAVPEEAADTKKAVDGQILLGNPDGWTSINVKKEKGVEVKPVMIRVTFVIPEESHTKLKVMAAVKGITMAEVLRRLISRLPEDVDGAKFQGRLKGNEKMARMTLDMPKELRTKLKLFVARHNKTTMADVLRWLISGGPGD